jgi:hypothetical protein
MGAGSASQRYVGTRWRNVAAASITLGVQLVVAAPDAVLRVAMSTRCQATKNCRWSLRPQPQDPRHKRGVVRWCRTGEL